MNIHKAKFKYNLFTADHRLSCATSCITDAVDLVNASEETPNFKEPGDHIPHLKYSILTLGSDGRGQR
jgi:hypothetical protein